MRRLFHYPENLDLKSMIMEHNHKHMKYFDRYLYILNKISLQPYLCDDEEPGTRLNKDLLHEILGSGIGPKIMRNLIDWGVIRRIKGYIPGKYSFRYELCDPYKDSGVVGVEVNNSELFDRLNARYACADDELTRYLFEQLRKLRFDWERLEYEFMHMDFDTATPLYQLVKEMCLNSAPQPSTGNSSLTELNNNEDLVKSMNIDHEGENGVRSSPNSLPSIGAYDSNITQSNEGKALEVPITRLYKMLAAKELDEPKRKEYARLLSVYSILAGDLYLVRNKKLGRVYSNFTSLKKELREALINDEGEKLVEYDISNSQPFFLSILLIKHFREQGLTLPPDVQAYTELTEGGKLYEHFISDEEKFNDRKKVKDQFIMYGLFCKTEHAQKSKFFKIFKAEFPNVAEFILQSKAENYKEIAVQLQREESKFMIDYMGKRFKDRGWLFVTVHDSALIRKITFGGFERYMKEYFDSYGTFPQIKLAA